jgi:predicted esterase
MCCHSGTINTLTYSLPGKESYYCAGSTLLIAKVEMISTGDPDAHVPVDRVLSTSGFFKEMNASVTEKVFPGKVHSVSMKEIEIANNLIFGQK